MHSHEARSSCYENARHVPGGGVRKCARKFKFDCFAGARNVRGATKINSDFGQPENTDPPGCKYRYYAKRLGLKLSLSTKFRKMWLLNFCRVRLRYCSLRKAAGGVGGTFRHPLKQNLNKYYTKYYTVHNNILNNGHNNIYAALICTINRQLTGKQTSVSGLNNNDNSF